MENNTRYIDDFVARLMSAGWAKEEAEAEEKRIQEDDDEDGYDGF
jgi:hypothetical protein